MVDFLPEMPTPLILKCGVANRTHEIRDSWPGRDSFTEAAGREAMQLEQMFWDIWEP